MSRGTGNAVRSLLRRRASSDRGCRGRRSCAHLSRSTRKLRRLSLLEARVGRWNLDRSLRVQSPALAGGGRRTSEFDEEPTPPDARVDHSRGSTPRPGARGAPTRQLPDRPVDPQEAWDATEAAWRDAVPALSNCLSPPRLVTATQSCVASRRRAGGWWPQRRPACPNAATRGETTTTAMCGFEISVTPVMPWQPWATPHCSVMPFTSSRRDCSSMEAGSHPPTRLPENRFRISAASTSLDIRAASTGSATGSTGSFSWTPSGRPSCFWPTPAASVSWMLRDCGLESAPSAQLRNGGLNLMRVSGKSTTDRGRTVA